MRVAGIGQGTDTIAVRYRTRSDLLPRHPGRGAGGVSHGGLRARSAWTSPRSTTRSRPFELISLEDTGLVPAGKAGRATLDGETALDGRLPVNPSGGLKARGHPLAATGIAQIVELCLAAPRAGRGPPGRGARGARPVHRRARHQQLGDAARGAALIAQTSSRASRCPRCRRARRAAGAHLPRSSGARWSRRRVPRRRRGGVVHHAALAARGLPAAAAHRAGRARGRRAALLPRQPRPRGVKIGSQRGGRSGRLACSTSRTWDSRTGRGSSGGAPAPAARRSPPSARAWSKASGTGGPVAKTKPRSRKTAPRPARSRGAPDVRPAAARRHPRHRPHPRAGRARSAPCRSATWARR